MLIIIIVCSSLLTVSVVTRRGAMVSKTSFPVTPWGVIIEVVSDSSIMIFWGVTKRSRNWIPSYCTCMHVCNMSECGYYNNTARSFILLLIRAVLCHVICTIIMSLGLYTHEYIYICTILIGEGQGHGEGQG